MLKLPSIEKHVLFVAALGQDVALALRLQIEATLNSPPELHLREVLLGDGWVEVVVLLRG